MKKITRLGCALLASLTALTMSGCSLSALTAENVMEPPQAYGDGAEIQAALEDALGPQITLRYPRSGEHRSAVVRADVDNDTIEEAIVFYRQATENSGAHMALLDIDQRGDWTLTGEYSGSEGEIDRVMFGDVNGDGSLDIITGWSVHSDYGALCVHSCALGQLSMISIYSSDTGAAAAFSYAEVSVGDFDGDRIDELLTVCLPGDENSGEARLLKWQPPAVSGAYGSIRPVSRIALHPGTQSYTGCTAGYLTWSIYGIVVDSQQTDGRYSSEILLWDMNSGALISPVSAETSALFSRTQPTVSRDVNGDSYIEIPGDSLLPDCSSAAARKVYLTRWYRYNGRQTVRAFSAIMRSDYGYYFVLPEDWIGRVTAQPDPATSTLHFYLADSSAPFTAELMRIKVFTMDEWDEEASSWNEEETTYIELCTTDYYVYAVQINDAVLPVTIDFDTVLSCFVLTL